MKPYGLPGKPPIKLTAASIAGGGMSGPSHEAQAKACKRRVKKVARRKSMIMTIKLGGDAS